MARMKMFVEEWHDVEKAVKKVLPGVQDSHGNQEACRGFDVMIGYVGHALDGRLIEHRREKDGHPLLVPTLSKLVVKGDFGVVCKNH